MAALTAVPSAKVSHVTDAPEIAASEIEDTLSRILASPAFARSPSARGLPSYIVGEARAGRRDRTKAYAIGVDALDKPADFDPVTDASVRVAVGRLRTAPAEFYASDAARNVRVLIDIPKGRYDPLFLPLRSVAPPENARIAVRARTAAAGAAIYAFLLAGIGFWPVGPASDHNRG